MFDACRLHQMPMLKVLLKPGRASITFQLLKVIHYSAGTQMSCPLAYLPKVLKATTKIILPDPGGLEM
jgi:hypothetical protein